MKASASFIHALGFADLTFTELEILGNMLLFIPVGVLSFLLLRQHYRWLALLIGPLISCVVELVQTFFLDDRVGSLQDVACNTAGTWIGVAASWVIATAVPRKPGPKKRPAPAIMKTGFADMMGVSPAERSAMSAPLLVAFDLDDTLAPSKSPVPPRIAELLVELADRVQVAIISGGQWEQFRSQVVNRLNASDAVLDRLHLMPTCGTQYYRHVNGAFAAVYAEDLSEEQKQRAIHALETEARKLGLWEENPAGDVIEDRGSQITFSALGQRAGLEAKKAWDPSGQKRLALRDAVAPLVPELEVRAGGSTSIDITRAGIDKSYGMNRLVEASGIALSDMLFFGDRLDEGGNDYPVQAMGVRCIAVEGWEETAAHLEELIPTLPVRV